ncbi:MAG: CCA tRNA nucleotidyltransferase [Candidatus Saccharibacteria bacterium]|nr:CCA tRNA nucleotidyltransferase [Candidatus Saccharibacteria bacterium]
MEKPKISIPLPKNVEYILNCIETQGEGFIVGGAVRDSLLGKKPKDYDITTNLSYQSLSEIFKNHPLKEIGKAFGILTVNIAGEDYEIAQYRKDLQAKDRLNTEVAFVEKIEDDLSRRDFSFNAMAYNQKRGLIDLFGGRDDLKSKTVRFIGNPGQRIREDGLRIMRAFRFMSVLNFDLAPETQQGITENNLEIQKVSPDRLGEEFSKIICGQNASQALIRMQETGVLEKIIPEFTATYHYDQNNPHHQEDLFTHTISVVENTENDPPLRYAALLHDIAKPASHSIDSHGVSHYYGHDKTGSIMAREILTRIRLPSKLVEDAAELIENHMLLNNQLSDRTMAKHIRKLGVEQFERLIKLNLADQDGRVSEHHTEQSIRAAELYLQYQRALKLAQPDLNVKTLAINGYDIMKYGYSGPAVGKLKEQILQLILDGSLENQRDSLENFLHKKQQKILKSK